MRLHSRNRKRKLEAFSGTEVQGETGQAFSMSFNDESHGSISSKRFKKNNTGTNDDDEIEIISST